jgi:hypothetical protein
MGASPKINEHNALFMLRNSRNPGSPRATIRIPGANYFSTGCNYFYRRMKRISSQESKGAASAPGAGPIPAFSR